MNVPYLDLKAQYAAIKDEIHAAIGDTTTDFVAIINAALV